MQKIVFDSAELPVHFREIARRSLWLDQYRERFGTIDIVLDADRPFRNRMEVLVCGEAAIACGIGTGAQYRRNRRHIANDPRDDIFIGFNVGSVPFYSASSRWEHDVPPGNAVILTNSEDLNSITDERSPWLGVSLPRSLLAEAVPRLDSRMGEQIDGANPVAVHLRRYLEFLLKAAPATESGLASHVQTSLTDLISLILSGDREITGLAAGRGLRAARLREIVAHIEMHFSERALSPSTLAARHGVSRRYVNDLLYQTGKSFAERVLELRLQKVRTLLADHRHDRLKIGEIALAAGFSDLSYFNRRFRARFGCSPTQYRSGKATSR